MNYHKQNILIEDLKKGEEKAFIYLVENYSQRLFNYAITLSKDQDTAQDILQNVFFKIWEKRKKIIIKSSLQNYLFKFVYNEFINHYKNQSSTITLEKKYFEELNLVVESYDENKFKKAIERISKEIQNLPPKCREVFLLSRKDGLTNIEISNYLNVSIKTVEAHITKAFSILRNSLEDKFKPLLFLMFDNHKKVTSKFLNI